VLEAVKVWPGKGEACRKVGATANLDSFCAHRPQRCAGRDEETDFEIKSRNRRRKKMRGPGKFLDKESAIQGAVRADLKAYQQWETSQRRVIQEQTALSSTPHTLNAFQRSFID
jgi:hypothetical protein